MANEQQLRELVDKYLSGKATEEEIAFLESRYIQWNSNQEISATENNLIEAEMMMWDSVRSRTGVTDGRQILIVNRRQEAGLSSKAKPEVRQPKIASRRKAFISVISASAAAIAAVTLGVWFYYTPNQETVDPNSAIVYQDDIDPGRNTAVLAMPNGEELTLSDAKTGVVIEVNKLKYTDGSLVDLSSQLDLGALAISTPRGGQYQVVLPDGTHVWLNADSKLDFSADFRNAKQRIVKLAGEAYFEVAKDKRRPFVVQSKGQQVQVLGTHFNINSYADENTVKTTLLEGSVSVSSFVEGTTSRPRNSVPVAETILRPGQQSIATANMPIKVHSIDTELAVAWKNNQFMFEEERIENVMRMLARWYNVDVEYEGQVPEDKFSGAVSKFGKISKVLEILESTGRVHFKIEGRRIVVKQ